MSTHEKCERIAVCSTHSCVCACSSPHLPFPVFNCEAGCIVVLDPTSPSRRSTASANSVRRCSLPSNRHSPNHVRESDSRAPIGR